MKEGDKVRYKAEFCRSIGTYTGSVPHARGVVKEIIPLGKMTTLAVIEWDRNDLPEKVNTQNLEKCP